MMSSDRRPYAISRIAVLILALGIQIPGLLRAAAPAASTHLFILSGQSNMDSVRPQWIVEDAEEAFPGDTILVAKATNRGKPIRYWLESWYELAEVNGIDPEPFRELDEGRAGSTYRSLLFKVRSVLTDQPRPSTVTLLWMQGESDTDNGATSIYRDALRKLIQSLRSDLKRPDLKVVIGRLSDAELGKIAGWDEVRKMQVQLANEKRRYAWVDTDDLNDKMHKGEKVNSLHLTPDGYRVFARRLVLQSSALIRGKEPAVDGRPE
jgi:hypothetical protein